MIKYLRVGTHLSLDDHRRLIQLPFLAWQDHLCLDVDDRWSGVHLLRPRARTERLEIECLAGEQRPQGEGVDQDALNGGTEVSSQADHLRFGNGTCEIAHTV